MKLHLRKQEVALVLGAVATLSWGGWVTKTLLEPKEQIVRVAAAELVREYMMGVAHSNWSAGQIERQTEAFTKTLDALIENEARQGKTVIITEAVLSKSTPDLTPEIRAKLMRAVQWPVATGPAKPLSAEEMALALPAVPE